VYNQQNETGRTFREPEFYIALVLRINFVASFETYVSYLHCKPSMLNNDESFMGGGGGGFLFFDMVCVGGQSGTGTGFSQSN